MVSHLDCVDSRLLVYMQVKQNKNKVIKQSGGKVVVKMQGRLCSDNNREQNV